MIKTLFNVTEYREVLYDTEVICRVRVKHKEKPNILITGLELKGKVRIQIQYSIEEDKFQYNVNSLSKEDMNPYITVLETFLLAVRNDLATTYNLEENG